MSREVRGPTMRREVESILVAHKLDPSRRELYVEGRRDRALLEWIVPIADRREASVKIIDEVVMPDVVEGGNRARVIAFLSAVEKEGHQIRGFIDADAAAISGNDEPLPGNVWLTDVRDLEGYVIGVDNLKATLQVGFARDGSLAEPMYASMVQLARWLSAVRAVSVTQGLRLPVSEGRWFRYVSVDRPFGAVSVDKDRVLRQLLQAAGRSLSQLDQLRTDVTVIEAEQATLPDSLVIHGRDAMRILTEQLRALNVDVPDIAPTMWMTFKKEGYEQYPNLKSAVEFLKG